MARVLVGAMPMVGHVTPLLPIVETLVKRGHDVRFYTGRKFRAKVESVGARFEPMIAAPDFDDADLDAAFPNKPARSGLAALKWDIKHVFIDAAVGQAHDFERILRDFPADVLLSEATFSGPAVVHERGGPPWAVVNPLPITLSSTDTAPFGLGLAPGQDPLGRARDALLRVLVKRVLFRDTVAHLDRIRGQLGLPPRDKLPSDAVLSPYLYMQQTVEAFEYPRRDLPPQVHFVGPLLPKPSKNFQPPQWWHDVRQAQQPVVHVTQGTIATAADQLLVPTLRALQDQDVLVVATTGGRPVQSLGAVLEKLPANARIDSFIPHAQLLPYVDVMVTNAGYNGVQMALAHGVPLVAAGMTEDKPEVAARIAWAGVGVNLKTSTPNEARIRQAVRQVLADARYRQRARAMSREIRGHDAAERAADLLERLIETRQPVLAH